MPEPSMGQPFAATPALRVSVGDVEADNGTPAQKGVIILEGGLESPYIISPPVAFQVQVQLRIVNSPLPWPFPPAVFNTEFHIVNLFTGVDVTGSPWAVNATAIVPLAAPAGDHGIDGAGDRIDWYSITTPSIPALAPGVYRVVVFGSGGSIFFVHDDTVILVQ